MKYLFLLLFQFPFLYISAQDTLVLKNGDIKIVQLLLVDKKDGIIVYMQNDKKVVQSISSLTSFTNHSSTDTTDFVSISFKPSIYTNKYMDSVHVKKIYTPHSYSKFSVGINLLSTLSSFGSETEISIASNYNQSFYGQYNFNKHIAVRLPLRVGFLIMTNERLESKSNKYKHIARDLIYEIGLEPLIMLNDKRKINPYILHGIYFGKSQGVRWVHADSILGSGNFNISVGPREIYYRVALNIGVQFNLSKHFALNFEAGGNINTAFPSTYAYTGYARYENVGGQAAINLVYRFKAKDQ
jgi:hypothetical protein